jgi:hypothetical protein
MSPGGSGGRLAHRWSPASVGPVGDASLSLDDRAALMSDAIRESSDPRFLLAGVDACIELPCFSAHAVLGLAGLVAMAALHHIWLFRICFTMSEHHTTPSRAMQECRLYCQLERITEQEI